MPRRRLEGRRCLVTGATSGLGRSLARELRARGARVFATGRDPRRLDALAAEPGAEIVTFAADLTDDASREDLLAEVSRAFDGGLDLAVHAAGVGAYGRFLSHEPSVLRRIVEVNFFAAAELFRDLHPLLAAGSDPALVVLGSIVARRGLPGRSEYSASKHALAGFVDAIRAEWTTDGIGVLLVNPGFTKTEFESNLLVDTAVYPVSHRRTMTAEEVASRTLAACERRKHEVTFSLGGRTLLTINRLLPRFLDRRLGAWTRKLYSRELGEGTRPQS